MHYCSASQRALRSKTAMAPRTEDPAVAEKLRGLLEASIARYSERNETSRALHEQATKALPGGNTRTVLHTDPFPLYVKSAKGHQVTSEDGQTYASNTQVYLDLNMPMLTGTMTASPT